MSDTNPEKPAVSRPENRKETPVPDDRTRQLLQAQMDRARTDLIVSIETHGISPAVLSHVMTRFLSNPVELPEEAVCRGGCDFCCHLRLGVSIPEAIILFHHLNTRATKEGLAFFRDRILETAAKGDTLSETFWHSSQTHCPFLDHGGSRQCLIYGWRPFSCRAYHSTDRNLCKQGFEQKKQLLIPCFPLYKAVTDMYATVFINAMREKGLHSFQVGFVKSLEILFLDESAVQRWIAGENVFSGARLLT